LRRHKKNGDKKWDSETEKNTDVPTYTADVPAGYGGTAASSNSSSDSNSTANASALSVVRRPSQKTFVGMRHK
jgi:hypothetical protein